MSDFFSFPDYGLSVFSDSYALKIFNGLVFTSILLASSIVSSSNDIG